jgi:phytoene dehydrogenase-like protein
MHENFDVIVVGAGAAGLTAAAYLSQAKKSVLVLEKDETSGGLVGAYRMQGFTFDKGARGIIDSGIVTPMARQLNLNLEFLPNPITMRVENEVVVLNGVQDVAGYGELLKKLFPDEARNIDAIFKDIFDIMGIMDVLYGIENPLFLDQPFKLSYVVKTLLPWMLRFARKIRKTRAYMDPIKDALRKHTKNEALIHTIAQHFFEATPSFFALSYFTLYLEYQYPKGSTQSLVSELERVIANHGGRIHHAEEVLELDLVQRHVKSTKAQYGYNELIWAGDTKSLYNRLNLATLDEKLVKTVDAQRAKFKNLLGADSILGVNYMVDVDPSHFIDTGVHAFFTPKKEGLAHIDVNQLRTVEGEFTKDQDKLFTWVKRYLEYNTFEISIPALRDPSLAPPGQVGVMASTLFDYHLMKHMAEHCDYDAFKTLLIETFTDILDRTVLPSLKAKTLRAFIFTPLTIESRTNNTQGSATGWSFVNQPFPVEFEFTRVSQSVKTPLPHVHQAGQWTFNPSGVPVALLTAKLAADATLKALKKRSP